MLDMLLYACLTSIPALLIGWCTDRKYALFFLAPLAGVMILLWPSFMTVLRPRFEWNIYALFLLSPLSMAPGSIALCLFGAQFGKRLREVYRRRS